MDTLIKGLELPKSFTRMMLWPDGGVAIEVSTNNYEQLDDNAIELKPHGRLIDADLLHKSLIDLHKPDNLSAIDIYNAIINAPTVLEAST